MEEGGHKIKERSMILNLQFKFKHQIIVSFFCALTGYSIRLSTLFRKKSLKCIIQITIKYLRKVEMIKSTQATLHGKDVYQHGRRALPSQYQNEKIICVEIWASRILHGGYSWIFTCISNILTCGTNDPIEHWWIRIKTDNAYYNIQKYCNGVINMRRTASGEEANQIGLYCACKASNSERWTKKKSEVCSEQRTLGWFCKHMDDTDFGPYSLIEANCQDFALGAYERIAQDLKYDTQSRYPTSFLGVIPLGLKF